MFYLEEDAICAKTGIGEGFCDMERLRYWSTKVLERSVEIGPTLMPCLRPSLQEGDGVGEKKTNQVYEYRREGGDTVREQGAK